MIKYYRNLKNSLIQKFWLRNNLYKKFVFASKKLSSINESIHFNEQLSYRFIFCIFIYYFLFLQHSVYVLRILNEKQQLRDSENALADRIGSFYETYSCFSRRIYNAENSRSRYHVSRCKYRVALMLFKFENKSGSSISRHCLQVRVFADSLKQQHAPCYYYRWYNQTENRLISSLPKLNVFIPFWLLGFLWICMEFSTLFKYDRKTRFPSICCRGLLILEKSLKQIARIQITQVSRS